MPRDINERKKRKALRKLRRAAELAEQGLGPPLTDWELAFLEDVEARIETYGAAFADPAKGPLSEPLSPLQARKLKEIDRKARGSGVRRAADEATDAACEPAPPERAARPALRVIPGGKRD